MSEQAQSWDPTADAERSGSAPAEDGAASLRVAVSRAGERIQEIIDAAERVAAEIRDEAEQQAAAHLQRGRLEADRVVEERESELAELMETVVARVAVVQRELDAFVEALRDSIGRIAVPGVTERGSVPSAEEAKSSGDEEGSGGQLSSAAVLRLTQMAVAGSDRAELERALRAEFGVADTDTVLDEILGGSSRDPSPRPRRFMGPARFDPPERTG